MFLINSRNPLFCYAVDIYHTAPLLPKLRGYFAEFLRFGLFKTLVYSTYSPVLVWSTVISKIEVLSRSFGSAKQESDYLRFTPPELVTFLYRLRILRIPILYGFRPSIRDRLSLRGLSLRRNP